MKKWKVKDEIISFPKDWDKNRILKWINARYIRVCPVCSKIDVSYNHFNTCNPTEEKVLQINRDMNNY